MKSLYLPGGQRCPAGEPGSLSPGSSSSGVALFELVLALAVVATLAAVAVSSRSSANVEACADAQTLKGALRATRTRALADIVPWSFSVAGQTGTCYRNGVAKSTVTFETSGVSAGSATFDNRGQPSGTMSFTVSGFPGGAVAITTVTGFVP